MNIPDAKTLLKRLRDGWLESAAGDKLQPGIFLTTEDISDLAESTGWSGLHLTEAVRRAFSPFDDTSIDRLFIPTKPVRGGGHHIKELDLLAILAGRVPALAAKVLFHGIGAGMHVTMKPSSVEPVFTRLLANSANVVDPNAPVAVATTNRDDLNVMVRAASICLVYGSDETAAKIQDSRRSRPTLTGPHMESFAVVFASSLPTLEKSQETANRIATDVAIYDQSGCLSPIAVFIQDGGAVSPRRFADLLLSALVENPIFHGTCSPESIAPVRLFLQESSLAGTRDLVLTSPDGIPPAIIFCSRIRPAPGWRTVQVARFDSPAPDLSNLMPHLSGKIQGCASTGTSGETSWLLQKNPKYRGNYICEPGKLQDPPALWLENGVVLAHKLRAVCAEL